MVPLPVNVGRDFVWRWSRWTENIGGASALGGSRTEEHKITRCLMILYWSSSKYSLNLAWYWYHHSSNEEIYSVPVNPGPTLSIPHSKNTTFHPRIPYTAVLNKVISMVSTQLGRRPALAFSQEREENSRFLFIFYLDSMIPCDCA